MADDQDTCWTLISRAAARDSAACSQFARSYAPLIRRYLQERWRQTPLAAEVEDALHDVQIECLRADGPLGRVDRERDFRSFLLGVVRNIALRYERRTARDHAKPAGGPSAFADADSRDERLTRLFDREWARGMVREARRLFEARAASRGQNGKMRAELLTLRFQGHKPIREIAAEWHEDPDVLHRAYAKARDEFRSCLRQVVSFHTVRTEADLDAECRRLLGLLGKT